MPDRKNMYIYKNGYNAKTFLSNLDNSLAKSYLEDINSQCDRFRNTEINELKYSDLSLFEKTGNRAIFEKQYFERRLRLAMFSLRCWLFGEKEDIKELEDILWATCNEYSWGLPAHIHAPLSENNPDRTRCLKDLFACETAQTIAETLSLCGDLLEEAVVKRCVDEVMSRIIEPFEKAEEGWEQCGGNWPAVCGGALGMAAVYLVEDEARLKKITDRTKASCNNFFYTMNNDGSYLEGVTYWMYAMKYYVSFDELLKDRTGETIVPNGEMFKKLASFPYSMCITNDSGYSFSDGEINAHDMAIVFGIFCKLNENYGVNIPEKSFFARLRDNESRFVGMVRNIEWFNLSLLHDKKEQSDVYYPDGSLCLMMRGEYSLGIKGGHNEEPHNHNDVASYMLTKGNDIICEDLASPVYTGQYFADNRYNFLNASSGGHSLPIVNACMQTNGEEYAADKFEKRENGVVISYANAYPTEAALNSLVRCAQLSDGGLTIKDTFDFSKNNNVVCERIVTKLEAKIVDDSKVILTKDNKSIAQIEAKGAKMSVREDLMNIPQRDNSLVRIIELEYCGNESMEIEYVVR